MFGRFCGPIITIDGNLLIQDSQGNFITDGSANVFTLNNSCYHVIGLVTGGTTTVSIQSLSPGSCESCLTQTVQNLYRIKQDCCEFLPFYNDLQIIQGPEGGEVGQKVNLNGACWTIINVTQSESPLQAPYYFGEFFETCDSCHLQSGLQLCELINVKNFTFVNCCNGNEIIISLPNAYYSNISIGDGLTLSGECYSMVSGAGGSDAQLLLDQPNQLTSNYCYTKECFCPTPTPTPFFTQTPQQTQPTTPTTTPTNTITPSQRQNNYLVSLKKCCDENETLLTNIVFEFGITPYPGWSLFIEDSCYILNFIISNQSSPIYPSFAVQTQNIYSGNTSNLNCVNCKESNDSGCETNLFLSCDDGLIYKINSFVNGVAQFGNVGTTYFISIDPSLNVSSGCFTGVVEQPFYFSLYSNQEYISTDGCEDGGCIVPSPTPTITQTPTLTFTPTPTNTLTVTPTNSSTVYISPTPTQTLTSTCVFCEDNTVVEKFVLCCSESFDCDEKVYVFDNSYDKLSDLFNVIDGTPQYIQSTLDSENKMFTFTEDGKTNIGSGPNGPLWTGYFVDNLNFEIVQNDENYMFYNGDGQYLGSYNYTPSYDGIDWGPELANIENYLEKQWYYNSTIDKNLYVRYTSNNISNECLIPNETTNEYTWTTYNPTCFTEKGDPNSNDALSNHSWALDRCFGALCTEDFWNQITDYNAPDCYSFKTLVEDPNNPEILYLVNGSPQILGVNKFLKSTLQTEKSVGIRSKCGYDSYKHEINVSLPEFGNGEFSIVVGMYKDSFSIYGEKDIT